MTRAPHVFSIPAGVPFLDALARGLLAEFAGKPEALSQVRIFLPTRRSVRTLSEAFLRQSEGAALLLPRLTPLGDVDADDLLLTASEDEGFEGAELPPALPEMRRRLLLARLIETFERRTTGQKRGADHALRLAAELARLLDRVETERLGFDRLASLVPAEYAAHWRVTLDFLRIVTEHWPAVLDAENAFDPAQRRNRLLEAQAARWREAPPHEPVIAAGSTGSIPATAELLSVIARLPQGRIVLPGLDTAMDGESWEKLEPSHPQFALRFLLERLEVPRDRVMPWHDLKMLTRGPLLTETMRPAATSEAWRQAEGTISPAALDGLERIDCPGPMEEAGVIALHLRHALETPGKTAALVTPDRELARRVAAELRRWEIEVDDSAGMPLAATPSGTFLRLFAAAVADRFAPVPLLALLKHPLAAGGLDPGAFRAHARALETAVLRGPRPAAGLAGVRAALTDAPVKAAERKRLEGFVDRIARLVVPFVEILSRSDVAFDAALTVHVQAAEALAASHEKSGADRLWAGDDGEAAARFVAELHASASLLPDEAGEVYAAVLGALLDGTVVRPRYGRHPRLHIWGPIEARLQSADLMVLGGLNEGIWPRLAASDPWMSRPMQSDFGLPEPERRIGQSAHDFVQAASGAEVVLTRAARAEGAPTVPSRWLLRLGTVLKGAGLLDGMVAQGAWGDSRWSAWQRALDASAEAGVRATRPEPRPPVAARPRELRLTEIGTWMRNPYAIYARHILALKPLDPIDADPGAAERGTILHKALHEFLKAYPNGMPENALEKLLVAGRAAFGAALERPGVAAFWWPRFERVARWFVEAAALPGVRTLATEVSGRIEIDAPAGKFVLRARADRIDRLPDGGLVVIDYKTGGVPRAADVAAGIEPQLPLEALIASAGGFEGVPEGMVAELAYWRLTGRDPAGEIRPLDGDPMMSAAEALTGLSALVAAFDDPAQPYAAHPDPDRPVPYDDYAHLVRVKEWAVEEGE
ncbi:MAG: double-strand break repair protein AddB [Alphaproteobacteria bacterium]|nr:double-strand break repair protein AddB [Alphaproteobacteria bacterium]